MIEAANRQVALEARKQLDPILWSKFLIVRFLDGQQHCWLVWKRLDGQLYAHDQRGDRPVYYPKSDSATDIARAMGGEFDIAWFE